MGKLYVSEYVSSHFNCAIEPAASNQVITYSGSVQSTSFTNATSFVRVHTDAICSIKFGANPTATTSDERMAANTTEYFSVQAGHKIAAIANS